MGGNNKTISKNFIYTKVSRLVKTSSLFLIPLSCPSPWRGFVE